MHLLFGTQESEGFLVKDSLLLKLSIRHPTYHQKCRDMQVYVDSLQLKIVNLKQQLRVSTVHTITRQLNHCIVVTYFPTESPERRKVKLTNK